MTIHESVFWCDQLYGADRLSAGGGCFFLLPADAIMEPIMLRCSDCNPSGVSGSVITGVFADAMSSMDSGINSLATVLVNGFIQPLHPVSFYPHKVVDRA
ncbi:MAG: hypothetical protein EOL87_01655 [Spartobacteria bacterium]|nr:hypothetical protein [Spartobacteria bacterium]